MLIMLWFTNIHVVNILIFAYNSDVIPSYAQVMPSPDPIIESLLVQARFLDVAKLKLIKIDNTLVITLVERLIPESHTFHLPVDECIITLEDVALQLGLCVDGKPVTYPTFYDWEQMCP